MGVRAVAAHAESIAVSCKKTDAVMAYFQERRQKTPREVGGILTWTEVATAVQS